MSWAQPGRNKAEYTVWTLHQQLTWEGWVCLNNFKPDRQHFKKSLSAIYFITSGVPDRGQCLKSSLQASETVRHTNEGSVCLKRKGLLYILNTALKSTVLMSGAPYGAAASGASGPFQGRGATFFHTVQCGTMAHIKGGTSACLPHLFLGTSM